MPPHLASAVQERKPGLCAHTRQALQQLRHIFRLLFFKLYPSIAQAGLELRVLLSPWNSWHIPLYPVRPVFRVKTFAFPLSSSESFRHLQPAICDCHRAHEVLHLDSGPLPGAQQVYKMISTPNQVHSPNLSPTSPHPSSALCSCGSEPRSWLSRHTWYL